MKHLIQEQRYVIQTLLQENYTQSKIAKYLGVDKSVINRELKRNSDSENNLYLAVVAQAKCDQRHTEKTKKIYFTEEVKSFVNKHLEMDYSPEQIAGIAKKDSIKCVSHERIYQHIWKDKKQGGLLYEHLRTQGKKYRSRGAAKDRRGQIIGRVDIDERPKVVDEKTRFGDLEIDLVIGKNHRGALLTINDRATGMLKMAKIESKAAAVVETAAVELLKEWKPFLHTITSDNGKEFANHQNIANQLLIDFYFAKPYHSWERGANENLNGLVRQYFPKSSSFEMVTDEKVKKIEQKLNNRPRKRLNYKTPNEVFSTIINNQATKVAFIT